MKAQSYQVLLSKDAVRPPELLPKGHKLVFRMRNTHVNKGRKWPRGNMNKPRGWIDSGVPGPVLWKEPTETSQTPSQERGTPT